MIVLHAMTTYDRSIGRKEAFVQEAASFVPFSDPPVGSGATQGPSGRHLSVSKGKCADRICGFDPRVNQTQPAGHGDLTRE